MAGIKPKRQIKIVWSPYFAYALGLLVTDGSLSRDGRHIDFTSKDLELVKAFKQCLCLKNKIGKKASRGNGDKKYYRIQFGDVVFYRFLLGIGLSPGKSKVIEDLDIPKKYFFDFMRGHFDGDGTFYSYYDPRWKSSFMFYTVFVSASIGHINWIRDQLYKFLKIRGHVTHDHRKITHLLKYAKKESIKVLRHIYYNRTVVCLSRKRLKIMKALGIIGVRL